MTGYIPDPALAGPLYGADPWPLRFHAHTFDAACFNTLACSIVYNGRQCGTRKYGYDGEPYDAPSGPPPFANYRDKWHANNGIVPDSGETFPGPVELEWTSLDGVGHTVLLDFDSLFKDRLILHNVPRSDVRDAWLDAKSIHPVSPSILVEINDRTVNVLMRALVVTDAEQEPGNSRSHFRDDVVVAWTHTY